MKDSLEKIFKTTNWLFSLQKDTQTCNPENSPNRAVRYSQGPNI